MTAYSSCFLTATFMHNSLEIILIVISDFSRNRNYKFRIIDKRNSTVTEHFFQRLKAKLILWPSCLSQMVDNKISPMSNSTNCQKYLLIFLFCFVLLFEKVVKIIMSRCWLLDYSAVKIWKILRAEIVRNFGKHIRNDQVCRPHSTWITLLLLHSSPWFKNAFILCHSK